MEFFIFVLSGYVIGWEHKNKHHIAHKAQPIQTEKAPSKNIIFYINIYQNIICLVIPENEW